jgi:hypothetical protein
MNYRIYEYTNYVLLRADSIQFCRKNTPPHITVEFSLTPMSMPWAEFKPRQFSDLTYLDFSLDTLNLTSNKILLLWLSNSRKLLSRHQNAGQNHDIRIRNSCFENVAHFRYLGTIITNQNLIQEKITRRLNSGIACLHKVKLKFSLYRPWSSLGLREFEAPTFSRQSAHRWK